MHVDTNSHTLFSGNGAINILYLVARIFNCANVSLLTTACEIVGLPARKCYTVLPTVQLDRYSKDSVTIIFQL